MALFASAMFVNHRGGPLPLIGDYEHALKSFLHDGVQKHLNLKEVKAIILVTGHWEEKVVTISSAEHNELNFFYNSFSPESRMYQYDVPGDPALAERIHETLKNAGINSKLDSNIFDFVSRGWDRHVFVPVMLTNPSASVPIVQISVVSSQDPEQHYKIGQALYEFRKEGIAILGSGMCYHNMKHKSAVVNKKLKRPTRQEFDEYLNKVCTAESEEARKEGLVSWRQQGVAKEAHSMRAAEHFMPLIVIAGAAGSKPGERIFIWDMSNTFRMSAFVWKE